MTCSAKSADSMARTCLFVKVLVVAAAVANVAWCTETVPDWAASARESELSSSTSECECIFQDDTQGHITQGCENDRCNNCGRCSQHQFSPDGVNFYRYCSCTGNEQCSEHCPQYNRNAAKWHHPPCQLPSGTEVHIQCDIFSTMTDECRDDVCWCYFNVDAGCPTSAVRVGGAIALVVLLCTCCVCVCRKFCKCCKGDQAQAATASVQDPLLEQVPTSTDPIGNRYGSFMQQAGQPPIVANGQQQQVMQQHVPQQQQQFMQQQHHGEEQRIPPPTHQPTSQATLAAPSPGASPAVNPAVGAASTLAEFCTSRAPYPLMLAALPWCMFVALGKRHQANRDNRRSLEVVACQPQRFML